MYLQEFVYPLIYHSPLKRLCQTEPTLVEKEALGKPEKVIRPGSHTNRDQCLALVPVRAARSPWSIGPGSVGDIRPGSWHEPGPKLSRRIWSRFVPRTGTNAPPLPIYVTLPPASSLLCYFFCLDCWEVVLIFFPLPRTRCVR